MIMDTWLGSIRTFLPLFLRLDNGIIVNHPYAHITLKVYANVQVYKIFTLSVQGTYANCTTCTRYLSSRISKVYEELACLFPFSNDEGYSLHTLITCSHTQPIHFCEFVHVHHITYHSNDEEEHNLAAIF